MDGYEPAGRWSRAAIIPSQEGLQFGINSLMIPGKLKPGLTTDTAYGPHT